jgi:hypothetical protein
MANVTEIHEALNFVPRREAGGRGGRGGFDDGDGDENDSHWGSFGGRARARAVWGSGFQPCPGPALRFGSRPQTPRRLHPLPRRHLVGRVVALRRRDHRGCAAPLRLHPHSTPHHTVCASSDRCAPRPLRLVHTLPFPNTRARARTHPPTQPPQAPTTAPSTCTILRPSARCRASSATATTSTQASGGAFGGPTNTLARGQRGRKGCPP